MKNLFLILFSFLVLNCSSNKTVYWCGDHACINKKERESYFKKTMIVEIRDLEKANKKKSEIDYLMEQAKHDDKQRITNEKDLSEQANLEQKQRIKEEKELANQAKLEQKQSIKEEKELVNQAKLEQKRRIKEDKELAKQAKLEQKRRIKEDKELAKQAKLEQKRRIKEDKELAKQIEQDEKKLIIKQKPKTMKKNSKNQKIVTENVIEASSGIINVDLNTNKFKDLAEKITKKNSFRSYPDINDIPN